MDCKHCGQSISPQAAACPGCGHPNKDPITAREIGQGGGAIVLIAVVAATFVPSAITTLVMGLFLVALGVTAGGVIRPRWGPRRFTRGQAMGYGAAAAFACLAVAIASMPDPVADHEPGAIAALWMAAALLIALALPISASVKAVRERSRPDTPQPPERRDPSAEARSSSPRTQKTARKRPSESWESIETARVAFAYEDAEGDETEREVDVHEIRSDRFRGYCHRARGVRTFRVDRVVGAVIDRETGEEKDPEVWIALVEQ